MSARSTRGTFNRSCRTCGWSGTYDTAARGDYAKRKHSCQKWAEKLAGQQRRLERLAAVDRTPKPCHHKEADHQHGTRAAYVLDRCRCHPCSRANADAETWRERQKAYGRYDKYVDAGPVREHVQELRNAGMGLKTVAKASGVSTGTMSKLMFGVYEATGTGGGRNGPGNLVRPPSRRMLRTTAEKVLAVEVQRADGATVDGHNTRLRLRALVAIGYSMRNLGNRLGIVNIHTTVHGTANGRPGDAQVQVSTAKAVEELFERLCMTLPPTSAAASRAKNYARAQGWTPPLALDDLELHATTPDIELDEQAIWRRMQGDKRVRLTPDEAAELVRRWQGTGRSLNEMQRITGINAHRHTEGQVAS